MLAWVTMPSANTMTLPAAVVRIVDPGDADLTFVAAVSVLAASIAGLVSAVAIELRGCVSDWAIACEAISAKLEINASLTNEGFTRFPNRDATHGRGREMLGRLASLEGDGPEVERGVCLEMP